MELRSGLVCWLVILYWQAQRSHDSQERAAGPSKCSDEGSNIRVCRTTSGCILSLAELMFYLKLLSDQSVEHPSAKQRKPVHGNACSLDSSPAPQSLAQSWWKAVVVDELKDDGQRLRSVPVRLISYRPSMTRSGRAICRMPHDICSWSFW